MITSRGTENTERTARKDQDLAGRVSAASVPSVGVSSEVVSSPAAGERAILSLLIPGLGQFAQRRFLAGAGQLGTVLTYAVAALALGGGGRAMLLAVAFNLWSAIDAYRHDRAEG